MNEYDVKRLALVLAVQAEIEAMKAKNFERKDTGMSNAYDEQEFWNRAEELRELASATISFRFDF